MPARRGHGQQACACPGDVRPSLWTCTLLFVDVQPTYAHAMLRRASLHKVITGRGACLLPLPLLCPVADALQAVLRGCRARRREPSDYLRVLEVNTVGPFITTQAFHPLLKKKDTRTVVNVSSGLGSISTNRAGNTPLTGRILAYTSSKAALNMRARPGRGAQALPVPCPRLCSACMRVRTPP